MSDWKAEADVSDRWPKFHDIVFVLPEGHGQVVGLSEFVEWLAAWRPERLTIGVRGEKETAA